MKNSRQANDRVHLAAVLLFDRNLLTVENRSKECVIVIAEFEREGWVIFREKAQEDAVSLPEGEA